MPVGRQASLLPRVSSLAPAYTHAPGRAVGSGRLSDMDGAAPSAPCRDENTDPPGTDMNNDSRTTYRGCFITTRSIEVPPRSGWAELAALPSTWTRRFSASFSVAPDDGLADSWQQFPTARFDTRVHASENALLLARRSIDLRLAEV